MKLIMFFLFPFLVSSTSENTANVDTISEARSLFKSAAFDQQSCISLVYGLKNATEHTQPILTAYKACGLMMYAKYLLNPLDKLSSFSKGKSLLEKCVHKDPKSVEIRFLRLAMQSKSPSFLGYSDHIQTDKGFIVKQFKSIDDEELKKLMKAFLVKADVLSDLEKKIIENY
jgi:hypothetical protein